MVNVKWDESLHPRAGAGTDTGGQWVRAGKAARSAAGLDPPGWSTGTGDPNVAKDFVTARNQVPENLQPYLSHYTVQELVKNGGTLYVADDGKNGFIIAPDGDIQNLFSANRRGKISMMMAMASGGTKLDCFDGFLPSYYEQFGFVEYKREANWTVGGPDVVFMRLP